MKIPQRLQPLIEDGLADSVVRQLMSGKEAMVFIVRCGDELRCAKVYKEASKRSFRQAVDYTEGRRTKNSRKARAMEKGTRYGRKVQEEAWQSAEVDALYRLAAAGVRVPTPYNFHEGVLLMELVTDSEGDPAPRLNDIDFTQDEACTHHRSLMAQVARRRPRFRDTGQCSPASYAQATVERPSGSLCVCRSRWLWCAASSAFHKRMNPAQPLQPNDARSSRTGASKHGENSPPSSERGTDHREAEPSPTMQQLPLSSAQSARTAPAAAFFLNHHGPREYLGSMRDVAYSKSDEIATAKLAVDSQVEHRQIADCVLVLKVNSDSPDVLRLQRWFLADELVIVPRLAFAYAFHDRLLDR
jgi:hypothetical protein